MKKPMLRLFNKVVADDEDPPRFPPQRIVALRLGPAVFWLHPMRTVTFGWASDEHMEQVT